MCPTERKADHALTSATRIQNSSISALRLSPSTPSRLARTHPASRARAMQNAARFGMPSAKPGVIQCMHSRGPSFAYSRCSWRHSWRATAIGSRRAKSFLDAFRLTFRLPVTGVGGSGDDLMFSYT